MIPKVVRLSKIGSDSFLILFVVIAILDIILSCVYLFLLLKFGA